MLRAARSTSALRSASTRRVGTPAAPRPLREATRLLVFTSPRLIRSTTDSSPAATFPASADRSATRRISAGMSLWYFRGRGPNALLPPRLAATAADIAAPEGGVRAGAPVGQLPDHRLMQRRHLQGPAEDVGRELEGALGLARRVENGKARHVTSPPAPSAAAPWSASRSSAPG